MESIGSSSTPPPQRHHVNPTHQPFSDRLIRAIQHRLRLLLRSDSLFFVLGATGNVYTVNICATITCTCPDRATPCKHILFVLIRVLRIPIDDHCLWRRHLRPCQVQWLLNIPISTDSLASPALRERFNRMLSETRAGCSRPPDVVAEGDETCPVCLEVMTREEKVVGCRTCKNVIHEECFLAWKKSSRRRTTTCVLCRARWRTSGSDQEKYLNLSAYVCEDDMDVQCSQPFD